MKYEFYSFTLKALCCLHLWWKIGQWWATGIKMRLWNHFVWKRFISMKLKWWGNLCCSASKCEILLGRLQLLRWKKKEGFLSDVFLCVNKDILRHVNIIIFFSWIGNLETHDTRVNILNSRIHKMTQPRSVLYIKMCTVRYSTLIIKVGDYSRWAASLNQLVQSFHIWAMTSENQTFSSAVIFASISAGFTINQDFSSSKI